MLPVKETIQVEFKSDLKGLEDRILIEEAVAMANSQGGTIYVGIEDDGTITGARQAHLDCDGVCALIANKTVPSIYCEASIVTEGNKSVLAIDIPKAETIVSTSSGKVLKRRIKGDGTPEMFPFYPYEYMTRLSSLRQFDPSAEKVSPFDEALLEDGSIETLKAQIRNNPNSDPHLLGLNDEDLLLALSLTASFENRLYLTMSGILILGNEAALRRFLPTHTFSFQVIEQGKVRANDEFRCNIVRAFERFAHFIEPRNLNDEIYENGRRIDIPYYDRAALREAFSNAIAHRDYSLLSPVRVIFDESGLTIANPGELIDGLTVEDLLSAEPKGRNATLSLVMKRIGFCEMTGRGVDRIYAGAAMFGKLWPEYSTKAKTVTVYFPYSKPDANVTLRLSRLNDRLSLFSIISTSFINKAGPVKASQLQAFLNVSARKIEAYLRDPLLFGLITYNPESKYYSFVSSEGGNQREKDETLIDVALSFAKENGGILTSSDLQRKLGIDPGKSYRLLKSMVKQRKIKLLSKGKYAKYQLL